MAIRKVGTYEIERVLARGGMAVVYLARQPALDRHVALKRLDLTSGQPALAQRFVDEARVVARLDHPNVVTVHDLLEHEGTPYIAMEYVRGGSLRTRIGHLAAAQVLGALDDVLAGLAHAAAHGITHRDLKPENVLVTLRGSCKIADFGIALARDAVTRLTSTGTAMGTPVYMAPEQAGGGAVDPRTDLYALGVMAYEMLAGRPPFPGDDAPLAVLYRHVHDTAPPLEPTVDGIPERLVPWVERLLAKDPADRFPGAGEARRSLEEIAVAGLGPYWRRHAALTEGDGETAAAPLPLRTTAAPGPPTAPTAVVRPDRWAGRRRYAALGGAALAAAIAAIVALGGGGDGGAARSGGAEPVAPFASDGSPAAVVGLPSARPRDAPRGSGAALLLSMGHDRLLPAAALGIPESRAELGSAVASADFDRDGAADHAVGAPGARAGAEDGRPGAVAVLAGSRSGAEERADRLVGPDDHLPGGGARFGAALAAGDLDGDGYGDLAVGAPGSDPFPVEDGGSGSVRLLFGGPRGLRTDRTRVLRRPRPTDVRFGSLLALGDVDRDGHVDLVEAGTGHSAYCAGGPDGPTACRAMAGGGARALGTADLTGDGRADVVHGVPGDAGSGALGGLVRVYRGTPRGPSRRPWRIGQDAPHIPGHGQAGDRFGSVLAVADVDGDEHADLLVGAPGEDEGAGRIVLVRGARGGHAATGNRGFEQGDAMPGAKRRGNAFGAGVAFARGTSGTDLLVAAPGAGAGGTVWVLADITPSLGAAGTRSIPLDRLAGRGAGRELTFAG